MQGMVAVGLIVEEIKHQCKLCLIGHGHQVKVPAKPVQ